MDTNALALLLFWQTLEIHLKNENPTSREPNFLKKLKFSYDYLNPTDQLSEDPCVQEAKNFFGTVTLFDNDDLGDEATLGKLLGHLKTLQPSSPHERFQLLLDLVESNYKVAFFRNYTGPRKQKSTAAFKEKIGILNSFM
jgi:hypothetical protein